MPDNRKMILNLFAGMQDALFLGDRFEQGEFVSFMQPGQFVSTKLKETTGSDDMAIQASIANQLVDSSYVNTYKDTTYSGGVDLLGSVSQVYADILTHEALPRKPLSQDQLKEISALNDWLTANRATYELYRDRYYDAVEAYDTEAAAQTPNPARLRRLAQKRDDAFMTWVSTGQKNVYEAKYGRLVYLTAEDPTTLWGKLQLRMEADNQQAPKMGQYYSTFLVPPLSQWDTAGWAQYENTISESDQYDYSKETSWSGGISGSWGLWSWGGGTSGSTSFVHDESEASSVHLKFEYLRTRINRPWIVEDVLNYPFWTWKKEYGGQMVSTGGNLSATPPIRPIGRMPVLPKYLVAVRNLEMSSDYFKSVYERYHREISVGASVGWGPFSVSGSYHESETTVNVHAEFDGVTFKIKQPQIIARSGILVPRSPNPNESLPWQGDQWFPPHSPDAGNRTYRELRALDYVDLLGAELRAQAHLEAGRVGRILLGNSEKHIETAQTAALQNLLKA